MHNQNEQILNLPVSLGRQELVLAPYGTVSWTPENIDLLLLPNGAFKREGMQSFERS
jgi:hypothetical protein